MKPTDMKRFFSSLLTIVISLFVLTSITKGEDIVLGGTQGSRTIVVPDPVNTFVKRCGGLSKAWDEVKKKKRYFRNHGYKGVNAYRGGNYAYVYRGAELLRTYLEKITNVEFSIISESQWTKNGKKPAIHVGRTQAAYAMLGTKLNASDDKPYESGYYLKSAKDRLFIASSDAQAVFHGCSKFLQNQCGVGFFWPTELGEDIIHQKELTFSGLDLYDAPVIEFSWSGVGSWNNPKGAFCERLGMRWPPRLTVHHGINPIFPREQAKLCPDWFSLVEGKRETPTWHSGWQPSMGSESAIDRTSRHIIRMMRRTGDPMIKLGLNDAVWEPCQAPESLALDGPVDPVFDTIPFHYNPVYSHRYWRYVEKVAEQIRSVFPHRYVGYFAVAGVSLPPANAQRISNVDVTVVGSIIARVNPELRSWEQLRLKLWGRIAGLLTFYDYLYQTGPTPRYIPHLRGETFREFQQAGVRAYYAEIYANIAVVGPKYWLAAQLLWNPNLDTDALLNEFYHKFFKEVAEPMSRFYAAIEKGWMKYPHHAHNVNCWSSYCTQQDPKVLTPEILREMESALSEAEKMARNPRVKKRLTVVRNLFELTRMKARLAWLECIYSLPNGPNPEILREDLNNYAKGSSLIDMKRYFETLDVDNPLIKMRTCFDKLVSDSEQARLNRLAVGIAYPPLASTDPSAGQKKVRKRIDERFGTLARAANLKGKREKVLRTLVNRVVFIPRLKSLPVLDGKLDDTCWQKIEKYKGFFPVVGKTNTIEAEPSENASFRIGHDGRNLYVAASLKKKPAEIIARCKEKDSGTLRKDDHLLVSVATLGKYRWAYCARVNANGALLSDRVGYGSKYWRTDSHAVARKTITGFDVELVIPFRAALISPQQSKIYLLNIEQVLSGKSSCRSSWWPLLPNKTQWWEPANHGLSLLLDASGKQLVENFSENTTTLLMGGGIMLPMNDKNWETYLVKEPSTTEYDTKTGEWTVSGTGVSMLFSRQYLEINGGYPCEVIVEYCGSGECLPHIRWYERGEDGPYEVFFPRRHDGKPTAEEKKCEKYTHEHTSVKTIDGDYKRLCMAFPSPNKAQLARVWLECRKEIRLRSITVKPILPLKINIDVSGDTIRTGEPFTVQATVKNISDKPVSDFDLSLAWPAGADRMEQGVIPAKTLAPGETTYASWWLTPVYMRKCGKFVVIADYEGMPRIVTKVKGPKHANKK